jgi:predicted transcriptional regulator
MRKKVIKVGIMPRDQYIQRTIDIASGRYKPKKTEPKIWFDSLKSLGEVLSKENRDLLKIILERTPHSIKELEEVTGRKSSNLSRTLKTMEQHGLVDLEPGPGHTTRPKVKGTDFQVEFGLLQ